MSVPGVCETSKSMVLRGNSRPSSKTELDRPTVGLVIEECGIKESLKGGKLLKGMKERR